MDLRKYPRLSMLQSGVKRLEQAAPKHVRRAISRIPHGVREAVNIALGRYDRSRDVSYKKLGKNPKKGEIPDLSSPHGAFYIGKIILDGLPTQIVKETLAFDPESRIYNEDALATMIDYAFSVTKPGQKVRIIIGRDLSELLNGPEDVKKALSLENQKAYLKRIISNAKERGAEKLYEGRNWVDFELITMEEASPENETLFNQLRNCRGEDQIVDIQRAYGVAAPPQLSQRSSALEIAQFLYWACSQNDDVRKIFGDMRPEKLDKKMSPESSKWYGLTEVAIRLRAILDGHHTHGGVNRQAVYDGVILKLIKGKTQKEYQAFRELYPLYKLLEGRQFNTVHINSQSNFQKLKRKGQLRKGGKWVWATALAWGIAGGVYTHYKISPPTSTPQTTFDPSTMTVPDIEASTTDSPHDDEFDVDGDHDETTSRHDDPGSEITGSTVDTLELE